MGPAESRSRTNAVFGAELEKNMDMQKLKTLAQDVTGWSNCSQAWLDSSEDEPAAVVGHIDDDGNEYAVATVDCDQYYAGDDSIKLARFYAAANPDTVLRLIARIEKLEAKVPNAKVSEGENER